MRLKLLVLAVFGALGLYAQTVTPPGGGVGTGICTLSGTQTPGYVLTATDNGTACGWATVGGASVSADTVKNAIYIADGGSVNAITGTTTTGFPGSYAAGQAVIVKMANTNTNTVTININSIGPVAVTKAVSTALAAGNLVANKLYLMVYDGTRFQVVNPTLLAADIPLTLQTGTILVAPALGTPASGVMTNVTGTAAGLTAGAATAVAVGGITGLGTGVGTFLATPSSANLAAALTNETGSGAAVFATSPALVTPDLGIPSAVDLTHGVNLPVSTGVSGLGTSVATFLATPSSANLASAITDETGTGLAVFGTSPTIVTPTIASFTNATHSHTNAAGGGQLNITTASNATGTPSSSTFLRGDNTWSAPAGTGTVTVVGSGSLTSGAVMQGGGTTTAQTLCALCTMTANGNLNLSASTGNGPTLTLRSADTFGDAEINITVAGGAIGFAGDRLSANAGFYNTATGGFFNWNSSSMALVPGTFSDGIAWSLDAATFYPGQDTEGQVDFALGNTSAFGTDNNLLALNLFARADKSGAVSNKFETVLRFGAKNANASPSTAPAYQVSATGTYTNAATFTTYQFDLYDYVNNRVVFFINQNAPTTFQFDTGINVNLVSGNLDVGGSITTSGGAAAGSVGIKQGTACTAATNFIDICAPTSVTAYQIYLPGAVGSTGVLHNTTSSSNSTWSFSAVSLTADVTGVLPTANIAVALANQTSLRGNAMAAAAGDATIGQVVAHGAKALGTTAVSSGACSSAVTDTATGTATTDVILATFSADPTGATGYAPSANGGLHIVSYPTADTVNFKYCNDTSSSITPGAVTLNWKVIR